MPRRGKEGKEKAARGREGKWKGRGGTEGEKGVERHVGEAESAHLALEEELHSHRRGHPRLHPSTNAHAHEHTETRGKGRLTC